MFFGSIASIAAQPTVVKLVIGMLSIHNPHAAAQRIRDVLNSLGNAAATNPQILRHRYIVSVIIAWWHLICVDVNI